MYIFGDIGNSDTKIYLVNSNYKILKRGIFSTQKVNSKYLDSNFKKLIKNFHKVEKILFCSVVPKCFNSIKKFLKKKNKTKVL